ncbi:MAG: GSCFA domain-containing protein [Flavobacteriales bacterium]
MKFRTELHVLKESFEIDYSGKLFFMGSCFSKTMYAELKKRGFKYLSGNPFGVLFNPISIAKVLHVTINREEIKEDAFFENQGIFRHWDFGSQVFEKDLKTTVYQLNKKIKEQHLFLKKADVIFITLGTAWVYELVENKQVVANCHKMPSVLFRKSLLKVDEIQKTLTSLLENLQKINYHVNVVFTVSPIRHIKNGIVENQRSKAVLLLAVHEMLHNVKKCFYFPSYELLMDDLRDYRYYEKDMLHPNGQAVDYIWGKFKNAYFSEDTCKKIKQVEEIRKALRHRSLSNMLNNDQKFNDKIQIRIQELKRSIDFEL